MLVGLTGSLGSGKSTLSRLLEERGAAVVDADHLAHEVIERPLLVQELSRALGTGIVRPDGTLDRREIGRRAFATPEGRSALNRIVRQPLEEAIWQAVETARVSGATAVIVDAPLLFEWGIDDRFDALVVVMAAEPIRRDRVRRRGMSGEEFEARSAGQIDPDQKAAKADFVIDNSGDLAALEAQAQRLFEGLGHSG